MFRQTPHDWTLSPLSSQGSKDGMYDWLRPKAVHGLFMPITPTVIGYFVYCECSVIGSVDSCLRRNDIGADAWVSHIVSDCLKLKCILCGTLINHLFDLRFW